MRFLLLTHNCFLRATFQAEPASRAFLFVYGICNQGFTDVSRTSLILDMSFIFFPKITHGGENGVGSGSSQGTEGTLGNYLRQVSKQVKVFLSPPPFRDLIQDMKHIFQTFPAGNTFAAGLASEKVGEILG